MVGFNQIQWIIRGSVLLGLGAFWGINSPVKAQIPPNCYMITQTGQYIDLSSICGVEETPTNYQNNVVTEQQVNQNQPTAFYGQETVVVPTGYSSVRPGIGGTVIYGQWQPILDSASLRREPGTGTLVQQLQEGQPVRVYEGMRTNNSVFVETQNGQRGWVNIWNLPGGSGVLP